MPEFDVLPGGKIDLSGIETDQIYVNIGPQHPSTHGVFRMMLGLQGETVTSLLPVVGHLHRCHEKIGERNLWSGNMPYTDRLDYLCPMYNNFGYVVAVERMMGIEVPERAEYIRVIMGELTRVVNHLLVIGFMLNDMGAMFTPFLYAFTEREQILDLFEAAAGSRMMCNYFRFGGVARDLPDGWLDKCRDLVFNRLERALDQFETLLTDNEILIARCQRRGRHDLAGDGQLLRHRADDPLCRAGAMTSARWSPIPSMTPSTLTCRPTRRATCTTATCSASTRRGRASRS